MAGHAGDAAEDRFALLDLMLGEGLRVDALGHLDHPPAGPLGAFSSLAKLPWTWQWSHFDAEGRGDAPHLGAERLALQVGEDLDVLVRAERAGLLGRWRSGGAAPRVTERAATGFERTMDDLPVHRFPGGAGPGADHGCILTCRVA